MIWQTAKAEHIGGRDEQQDRVEILAAADGSQALLVLADGMGGHAGGEMAAQAAIDIAGECWRRQLDKPSEPPEFLAAVVAGAHARINEVGEQHGLTPRATIVALHLAGGRASWVHVGDSRLYRFAAAAANSADAAVERTHDHSVVQMLVDMGKVEEHEMGDHPDQNRLTRSLGGEPEPKADIGGCDLAAGDAFVLCSDGLWENASEDEMSKSARARELGPAARDLASLAAKRGGRAGDNVAIAIARIEDGAG
ncbi:MAG: PP2C family protein-serine/threonine phosphatase [Alphaproteobacteria bacterium]